MDTNTEDWNSVPAAVRRSLLAGWRAAFPIAPTASAIYGRWWQLETWLRSLCYLELRSKYGFKWSDHLPVQVEGHGNRDRRHGHMPSPDAQLAISFLDTPGLMKVIEDNWELFDGSLLPKKVWPGRMEELVNVRNRIGHCRRPHQDDLSRLEQALRDLEPGLLRCVTAFNERDVPEESRKDPVVKAWISGTHETARRLLNHAESKYEVSFRLSYSLRPWASPSDERGAISGRVGYLWHARWIFRNGDLDLKRLWEHDYLDAFRNVIVFVCSDDPGDLQFVFSAVDEPQVVADAIGDAFDAALETLNRRGWSREELHEWGELNADLDPRVQVSTPWTNVDRRTRPVDIFEA